MIDQYIEICIWPSGESTRLSQMWPGFKSQRRFHMWAEFIAGSLPCSERFFAGYSDFPPPKKTRHFQIPVTPVMVVKRFSIFFFANGRITFIKFEGCFVKGQIRPNGFKIPKCCIVKCLNFTVPFEKKIENLFFSENVLIGQSSSKRPGFSARTVSHCLWLFNL